MVTVKEFMDIEFFKENHLTLVAGANGLNRIVKRPNIAQLKNFFEWMEGGEFLVINGISLNLNEGNNFMELLYNANKAKVACIAFELSPDYIPQIPNKVIEFANEIKLPIFTLPWDVSFGKILNTIYDYIIRNQLKEVSISELMKNILFTNVDKTYALEQAKFYGYNLNDAYCVVTIQLEEVETHHTEVTNQLRRVISEYNIECQYMVLQHYSNIIIFIKDIGREALKILFQKVYENFHSTFPDKKLLIGVGNSYKDIDNYKKSYRHALKALSSIRYHSSYMAFYDDLGFIRLIADYATDQEIHNYVMSILGKIMDEENVSKVPLINTLDVYQQNNFNIAKTAEALYIHRNTLLQRLEKIENAMGKDLKEYNVRREIMNAFYLKDYVEN